MIAVVTGFVPIPGHPRSEDEYHKLGARLLKAPVSHQGVICMTRQGMRLTDCWLHQYLDWRGTDFTHSVSDNPRKNTPAYHMVQAEKSQLLVQAAQDCPTADLFIWIDYGIYHLRGMTDQVLSDFLGRVQNEQAITIPGCWSGDYLYNDAHPCWRFCGGVMIVPKKYVIEFDTMWKAEYLGWIKKTNNLSWEVNTLARMERHGFPLFWYQADHNSSMFTAYRGFHACEGGNGVRPS